jgi:peptidoglycan LD-endopeptidase LytH
MTATGPARTASFSASVLVVTGLLAVLLVLTGCTSKGEVSGEPVDSGYPQASSPQVLASGSTSAAGPSTAASTRPASTASPTPVRPSYVFPVRSKAVKFGRFHHDYPATDIFAPCGSAVVAPIAGRISEVTRTDAWSSRTDKGAARGGLSVSILGTDGARYYGSHLRSILTSLAPGRRVAAGQLLGQVGNTGDARGIACHLHFGISPPCGKADWWNRRGVLSPYRFLKSWQADRNLSPEPTVLAWHTAHGCPASATTDP